MNLMMAIPSSGVSPRLPRSVLLTAPAALMSESGPVHPVAGSWQLTHPSVQVSVTLSSVRLPVILAAAPCRLEGADGAAGG